jgi:nicotinamide riboside kinase
MARTDENPRGHGQKIALSGCFSSGKTTLFGILSTNFPQLAAHAEIATMTKLVCPSLDWRSDDVRGYLRWAQIISERTREKAGGVGLFDGSYADLVAHERLFGTRLRPVPQESEPAPYALTLLCDPVGVPLDLNGIRETEETLRVQLHKLVVEEVALHSARVVELSGTLDARVATAIREVHALLERLEGQDLRPPIL